MINGTQIRRARVLLGWPTRQLARAAGVRVEAVERAERSGGELPLTIAHATAIQSSLERAGVEFTPDVRLTTKDKAVK